MKRSILPLQFVMSVAFLCAFAPLAAGAADLVESHPGYFAIEDLGVLSPDQVKVEVDLAGPILRMVAGATASSDPELSQMLSQLLRIRVLTGVPAPEDAGRLDQLGSDAMSRLTSTGWQAIVRVREADERVGVFVREEDGRMLGLVVLAVEADEIALVNIVGEMDPALLGRLTASIDAIPDISIERNGT